MNKSLTLSFLIVVATLSLSGCGKETVADKTPATQPSSMPSEKVPEQAEPVVAVAKAKGSAESPSEVKSFGHGPWDALLKSYVSEDGPVRYKDWKANADDLKALDTYIEALAGANIVAMSKPAQLAFYINAYNAYTIKAVLERYPISSVMKVEGDFFKGFKHNVAGEEMTLDTLENVKIREGFEEARIHFVVNCASVSCPKLMRDAITPENMDALLESAAKAYILKETRLTADNTAVSTSEIFKWFKGDFEKASGSVGAFLAERLEGKAAELAKSGKVIHHPYDWALNEVK